MLNDILLNDIMLNDIMLNVIMLNANMLSVVTPNWLPISHLKWVDLNSLWMISWLLCSLEAYEHFIINLWAIYEQSNDANGGSCSLADEIVITIDIFHQKNEVYDQFLFQLANSSATIKGATWFGRRPFDRLTFGRLSIKADLTLKRPNCRPNERVHISVDQKQCRSNVSWSNLSRSNVSWSNVSRPNVSRSNVSRPNVFRRKDTEPNKMRLCCIRNFSLTFTKFKPTFSYICIQPEHCHKTFYRRNLFCSVAS